MKLKFLNAEERLIEYGYEGPEETRYRYDAGAFGKNGEVTLYCIRFKVLRLTPSGAWIDNHGSEKFVLNGVGKRFAHSTKKDALYSFIQRRKWMKAYAGRTYDRAEAEGNYAKKLYEEQFNGDPSCATL